MPASLDARKKITHLRNLCGARALSQMSAGADMAIWEQLSRQLCDGYKILDQPEATWSFEQADVWNQMRHIADTLNTHDPSTKELTVLSNNFQAALDQLP